LAATDLGRTAQGPPRAAVYVALRRVDPSVTLVSTGLWLLAIAMIIAVC
jgi:hypothetical protein